MTEVIRLTLVSHGMTDAMAAGRFPADEPLNPIGHTQVGRFEIPSNASQLAGPELRARQTAELLGLHAATDQRLADLDYGSWRGTTLGGIPPDDLQAWLTDPTQAPHGGESIAGLIGRVAGWLKSLIHNALPTVAVTHPAVIRAAILVALDAPPTSFWRIDIAPGDRTVLHYRDRAWTLRWS
ncbi:histidine phosphatase [Mycobacterium sp. 852002-51163_SCH5372311]|uniref:histidine phosphatase family protein n=1 Tax=Mycobacterium sp. 852002-51163_SCH5372311 TaxID=1834097 RepID=UPI0007FED8D5|nr:histidine phosphatase family protein [Mycobacterium sp. 852002-51163_SCH5372311]OBF80858.1 histidine phosphatase [Mycobacterium sp. 852002-51163_SCH5372311]